MTIAASLYDWLKLLHIVAAMIWAGGAVSFSALAAHVLRRAERDTVSGFVGRLRVIAPLVLAPAVLAVLGLGIWLVLDSDAWDFGQTWVELALALFAATFLIGAVFQGRSTTAARRAAAAGDEHEAARQLRRSASGTLLILSAHPRRHLGHRHQTRPPAVRDLRSLLVHFASGSRRARWPRCSATRPRSTTRSAAISSRNDWARD